MRKHAGLLMLLLIGCLTGCQTARYVMRDAESGVVAIPANSSQWPFNFREQAEELMADHFPAGYEIEREEEIVIGQETTHNDTVREREVGSQGPIKLTVGESESTTTTVDKTEYRIYYRRK